MSRAITIFLIGLAAFVVAAVVGFLVAAWMAPERLRSEAENALSAALGATVHLAPLQLSLTEELPWILVEATHSEAIWQNQGLALSVESLSGRVDPISLVLGRLELAGLELDAVTLTVSSERAPEAAEEAPRAEPVSHWVGELARLGGWLRDHPCWLPDLELSDGRILRAGLDDTPSPLLEQASGRFSCGAFRRGAEASLEGLVGGADGFPAELTYEGSRGTAAVSVELRDADLPAATTLAQAPLELTGRIDGRIDWRAPRDGPQHLSARLRGAGVRGPLGGTPKAPALLLDLARPALHLELLASPEQLVLQEAEIQEGGVTLRADGSLRLPVRDRSPLKLVLEILNTSVASLDRVLAQLPPTPQRALKSALSRLEDGHVRQLRAAFDASLQEFQDIFRQGPLRHPGRLVVDLAISDAVFRLGEADRASEVGATLRYDGDRLELHQSSGRYHDRDFEIQIALSGISNLQHPDEISCTQPLPVPALPGIDGLREWIDSRRQPGRPPGWQQLDLDLDWISHPVLLCGVEAVRAGLRPAEGGFDFDVARGVWAGLPVKATGSWRRETGGTARVVTAVEIGPPFEGMAPTPHVNPWARGRFDTATTRLGRWQVNRLHGSVRTNRATLTLEDVVLSLTPGGEIQGDVAADLGEAGPPPFRVAAQFQGIDLMHLWTASGLERGALSGTLYGAGAIAGQLRPGLNPLADATGHVSFEARDGTLTRRIPILLAIAVGSGRFNPFSGRDLLAYDAIDMVGRVADGRLSLDTLTIEAPTLRMAATGSAGTLGPFELETVVGIFFFRTLDSLIDRIPLLNRVILGTNRNLVGAYLAVTGPLDRPKARVIPTKTLVEGLPGSAMTSIPSFVLSGVKRIQSVVRPERPPPEQQAAQTTP